MKNLLNNKMYNEVEEVNVNTNNEEEVPNLEEILLNAFKLAEENDEPKGLSREEKRERIQKIMNGTNSLLLNGESEFLYYIDKIPVYKNEAVSRMARAVGAYISINPVSMTPFIMVDDLFESCTLKTQTFILYHEIGHYSNGDFNKKGKMRLRDILFRDARDRRSIKKGVYPRREVLADYYAMDKMNSLEDAKFAINELYDILIAREESKLAQIKLNGVMVGGDEKKSAKMTNKLIKALEEAIETYSKSRETRLQALEEEFILGPYFIDEEAKLGIYDDAVIEEEQQENEEE